MYRFLLAGAIAGSAALCGLAAQAQDKPVGPGEPSVMVAPEDSDIEVERTHGTRVYGFYRDNSDAMRPSNPGGCGTYFYWDGAGCVDARDKGTTDGR